MFIESSTQKILRSSGAKRFEVLNYHYFALRWSQSKVIFTIDPLRILYFQNTE
jgi:hypothetical protein